MRKRPIVGSQRSQQRDVLLGIDGVARLSVQRRVFEEGLDIGFERPGLPHRLIGLLDIEVSNDGDSQCDAGRLGSRRQVGDHGLNARLEAADRCRCPVVVAIAVAAYVELIAHRARGGSIEARHGCVPSW
jgi:hypothetical protein